MRPKFGKIPEFHYDLGLAHYNMNKMSEAQGELQEALRLAPDSERTQFLLAACLASTGDSTKALDMLHKLVKEHPSNSMYWATLGQILGPMGGENSAEAVKVVHHALAVAPHDPHTQYVAATVFVQTGDLRMLGLFWSTWKSWIPRFCQFTYSWRGCILAWVNGSSRAKKPRLLTSCKSRTRHRINRRRPNHRVVARNNIRFLNIARVRQNAHHYKVSNCCTINLRSSEKTS